MRLLERRQPRTSSPSVWRRFRVTQAHELRQRLRIVPPIVAALLVVSSVTIAVRYPASAVEVLLVNAVAGLVLLAFGPLSRFASHRGLTALAFMMPTVTGLAMAATMTAEPATFATAMGALAIIPIGVPLLLAWGATTNLWWAVAYAVGVGALAMLTGFGSLSMNQRLDVASLVATCCVVGVLNANLLQGLRLRSIEQELELRRLNRVLHGYATTDPLTRLRNRRQLDTDVAIIWPSIRRRGVPCSVVVFDLDHFKRLNDERGHAAGDSTLLAVATELQRQVRGRDSVYRIGGEEFLVLLRDTPLDAGLQVAERIRLSIAELELPASGGSNPARLTISGGVAVADESAVSWDAVVAAADAGLYAAKAAGRNRVFGPDGAFLLVA